MNIVFSVHNQIIERTDANVIVADSRNYLQATFIFSEEWNGKEKTAIFIHDDKAYHVLLENDKCLVPWEVIKPGALSVSVFAGDLITTNACVTSIKDSGYTDGTKPSDPTPTIYEQIMQKLDEIQAGTVDPDEIAKAVEEYLKKHPIETLTEEDVQRIVSEYVTEHKDELKGNPGDPGADGKSAYDVAVDNGFVGTEVEWLESLKGEPGNDGVTPNLTIGTVETLTSGSNATATITGNKENPVLNLGIPRGADGKDGAGTSGSTVDILEGKKILFVGDSICEGVGANNKPYPYWIQQNHPNANVINLGVGGMTISRKDSTVTNCIPQRIQNGEFENEDYSNPDIVIFEGGVNDMMRNVKLGEITNSYSAGKNVRFCDALEYMFKYFKDKFPSARMIFTSIHRLSSMDVNLQNAWWELTSEVCSKWGIEYIDLYSLVNANVIPGLDLHPNENIHQKYYTPIIDNVLCGSIAFASEKTDFYLKNRVVTIFYQSGTKTFNIGDDISTSDWRINGYRTDLTTYINATSGCSFDISDVDNTQTGTYPVHVSYVDNGRVLYCDVMVTVSESAEKVLDTISATKISTSSAIGENVTTSDITVTAHYTDGTSVDVTESASIDISNVNTEMQGEYSILITYSENGITCNTSIAYNVTENPEPSEWDDEITLERAWQTDQYFPNTNLGRFEAGVNYNIKFNAICESASTISGSLIFKTTGGQVKDVGPVTNEQFSVDWNVTPDTLMTNVKILAYTTGGSGFPWTVKIKDVAITEA